MSDEQQNVNEGSSVVRLGESSVEQLEEMIQELLSGGGGMVTRELEGEVDGEVKTLEFVLEVEPDMEEMPGH